MKKVCLIDFDMSVRGGVEQVTASLANALADCFEVHLLGLCEMGSLAYTLDERVKYTALSKDEQRLSVMRKELKPVIRNYLNSNKIDVAIIQGNYPGFIVSTARFGTRTRLVFCDHGALMNQWERRDIVVIRLISSLLCHKVITLTEQSREDYIRKFRLPRKKVDCIYNWVDLSIVRSEQYNKNSKRIISAGRFGKEKGFDMLIKAFAPVAKKHTDWHLDLFGDGEMMETVKALIEEYGISDNVHLMGMRSDLAERYKDYSMYVLPSYREGMPLVLLEAKANRLPIVSFDILTGPKEIVRDGIDGILIKPYDTDEMARAMCALIEDNEMREAFSVASQENLDKFSKKTILTNWKQLIEKI